MSDSLHIDWTKCDGRGLCTELLPALLARDEWGYPVSRRSRSGNRTDVPVSAGSLEAARDAVQLCPKLALSLVHEPNNKRA
ncbi:ferredoxin [Arthrobacter sp. H16F315]|uniref:ferredoxin n=1 Tax=Arthrobacter sp. H16F315 TaxID=2955314 RepID=UPI002097457B|nr:ferredoxin [Arthrobacter sp. H16F315]MDD1476416.1 ferredoxin [Arthrobacter sp. H16F315]